MMSSGAIPIHAIRMEKPWDFNFCLPAWLQDVQVACRWCLSEPASDSGLIVPVGFPESGFEVSFFMADDAVAQHYPDQR